MVDALLAKFGGMLDVVPIMSVAAVDDDVAGFENVGERRIVFA